MVTESCDLVILDSVSPPFLRRHAAWCGREITGLIDTASLPTRVLRRILSHRQLAWQPPPIEVNLECYYCGTVHPKLQLHVYDACPAYYVLQLVLFVRCILDSGLPLKGHVVNGKVYMPEGGPYVLRYLPDTWDLPTRT